MNKKILFAEILLAFLVIAAFRYIPSDNKNPVRSSRQEVYKNKMAIHCSPDWNNIDIQTLSEEIGPLPGVGNFKWQIKSSNDSAVFYFNQGINMYYGFHIIESAASFYKAKNFDSSSAMIWWAIALAYGPNINDFEYSASPVAYAAAQKAVALSSNCTADEKLLINAMAVRYSLDSTKKQSALNALYSAQMKKAYDVYPAKENIEALYADALMNEHPWNYWKHDGQPQSWTPTIVTILEKLLKQDEAHPGANHYYIHMMEASGTPEKALPCANRLGKLMPGLSHVVHMPSHIYIRTGYYKQGETANEDAVAGYNKYLTDYPKVADGKFFYVVHNIHLQVANAMMLGDEGYSMKTAVELVNSFDTSAMSFPPPFGTFAQYISMTPVMIMVRYGKWKQIINSPVIPSQYSYANLIWHWARGLAFAAENDIAAAKKELGFLQDQMKLDDMKVVFKPFNAPLDAAKISEEILEGRIALKENNYASAIQHFKKAVINEDALIYNEPRDWLIPARQYLGDALLAHDPFTAEKIFREDLKINPKNVWSEYGLFKARTLQKKSATPMEVPKLEVSAAAY